MTISIPSLIKVGLCVASLLNKMLTTMERVETGLAGFLCVDIFRILAAHKCDKMRLPTGSTFMASQTCSNLQSCALASVVMCVTKHREFDPWRSGDCRLSELSIEQYFGHLRIQSSNSQLSTRAYFHAAWKAPGMSQDFGTKSTILFWGFLI